MEINSTLVVLILSLVTVTTMTDSLAKTKNKNKLHKYFIYFNITLMVHVFALILQILFNKSGVPLIYFDYLTYTGAAFSPFILLNIALIYTNNEKLQQKLKKLFFIPLIFLLALWTNDLHRLFYEQYSVYLNQTRYGPILIGYAIYSYGFLLSAMTIIVVATIKRSGFFSIQTFLITVGIFVPLVGNMLGLLQIVQMTIYVTPILFIITALCFSIAIIKYKALNITPVAFRTVIDTMSDAFIVISDDGTIVDKNLTFENIFKGVLKANRDDNFFQMLDSAKILDIKDLKLHIEESRSKKSIVREEYHIVNNTFDKYFQVVVHPIKAKEYSDYIGTLLLFNDITQHKIDIKEIEDKQDVIVKQGQLVSIGELAGGMAHDINTPISAIKTGLQMLTEVYTPRDDMEKELLFRMSNCTEKIIKIVNSMRNQIRNLGSDQMSNFKISAVIEDIRIVSYNELQKNKCELSVTIEDDLSVYGDPTKLGQVFTNLFVNAAQAYEGKGGKIEASVSRAPNNMVMIKVRDYAGGIPERIKASVFKNILTTKGSKGTGLGLYLAYSVIKGEFSGDITFESVEGQGTTFYILLNRASEEVPKAAEQAAEEVKQENV